MKKLYIKILGVAVFVTVLSVNVSMNRSERSQDATVVGFSVATEANAECIDKGSMNNGRCFQLTQHCSLNPFPEDQDCDFYSN